MKNLMDSKKRSNLKNINIIHEHDERNNIKI